MTTTVKTCIGCGQGKPLSDFYKHPETADGHLSRCKVCFKAKAKENRLKNIEHWREYDRQRAKTPERRARTTENNRNNAHRRFRTAVSNAVRDGKLIPLPCFVCGAAKVEAHHPSYSEGMELVVTWLCQLHHQEIHGRIMEHKQ